MEPNTGAKYRPLTYFSMQGGANSKLAKLGPSGMVEPRPSISSPNLGRRIQGHSGTNDSETRARIRALNQVRLHQTHPWLGTHSNRTPTIQSYFPFHPAKRKIAQPLTLMFKTTLKEIWVCNQENHLFGVGGPYKTDP